MNTPFIAGAIFTIFGLFMLRYATRRFKNSVASESWPSVIGQIVTVDLWGNRNIDGEAKPAMRLNVEYKYKVAESVYTNKGVAFYTLVYPETMHYAESHPVNSDVSVYYNPSNPAESVLIPGPRKDGKRHSDLIIGILGTLIGLSVSIAGWFGFIG